MGTGMLDGERIRRWLQRVPGPEPQPVRLPQKRIYVLPTGPGMAMATTLGLMLIATINYNLSLGFVLIFLFAGVGLAHTLQSWRALLALEIRARPQGEAFVGGEAAFVVQLADAHGRARDDVTIRSADSIAPLSLDVSPHGMAEGELRIAATQRGAQALARLTLECRAPLGWVRAWSYLQPDATHIVYPQPAGKLAPVAAAGMQQEGSSRSGGGQEEFAGLRELRPTDSPRHIAWKQAARGGPLLAKQFGGGLSPDWLLDWAALPAAMPVEARLSQLTQWVLAARAQGVTTQLRLPGRDIGPGRDAAHHAECLRALALFGEREAGTS